jgi:hypothetical protein
MSLRWEKATVPSVQRFIKHPAYAGAYVYGTRHWRRVRAGADRVPENRLIGQFVEQWDHHEGYITKEEYEENQRILALNAKVSKQAQLGPGPALLQGRCFCARHGAMVVHYHHRVRARGRSWSFQCQGDYLKGGDHCVSVSGIVLETLVVGTVLKAIDVPTVDEARRFWRANQRDWGKRHRGLETELDRKIAALNRLKQRLLSQEAGDHLKLFAAMLEDEFEKCAAEVERLKQRIAREEVEVDPFTEQRWQELKALCGDVMALWEAPTTTDQDRKQLVRILVDRVVIENVEQERVALSVEWADGRPRTRLEILRAPYYHRLMWEWHLEGLAPEVMVERLGAMEARTQQERAWSMETVKRTLWQMAYGGRKDSIALDQRSTEDCKARTGDEP